MAQTSAHQPQYTPCSVIASTPRGEWPPDPSVLPYLLTEDQLAHLRGKSVRTLQRERRLGCSIPFIRDGKRVLYARADVLAHYGAAQAA